MDALASKSVEQDKAFLTNTLRIIKTRLAARTDSEHETSYSRFGIHALVTLCAVSVDVMGWSPDYSLSAALIPYFAITLSLSLLIFAHIIIRPESNPVRRYLSIIFDTFCITYTMHIGGEYYLWMYPFLLWAIFGNGFRFGVRYLFVASAVAVAGFALLLAFSPFWHRYPALSWGCLAGLITLPAYVSVLIRKLEAAKRQAEESNRAKSAFLASISHELRTPLTAIIGLSDLMRSTQLNREQGDMNETIGDSGRTLLSLINAILDLSRLEVGKMPKNAQKIDLYRLFHRVIGMISVTANSKGVRIALHFSHDVPRFVETYLKHIEDALVNLASNAAKFTESGYVLINVSGASINSEKLRLKIEVTDSGIGIAEEAQSRIFERFSQADDTIIDKFGGTGLGLATVKQMIEDIGGAVGVNSVLGSGSTFWFELDVAKVEAEVQQDWKSSELIVISEDMRIFQGLESLGVNFVKFNDFFEARKCSDVIRAEKSVSPIIFLDARICGSDLDLAATELTRNCDAHFPRLIAITDQLNEREYELSPINFVTHLPRPIEAKDLINSLVLAKGPKSGLESEINRDLKKGEMQSLSILLADDNKVNRAVISRMLSQSGHRVEAVENGRLAIEALQENHFDIALFDLNMPVMNGIEAAKLYQFTAIGAWKTPILALTADATSEAEMRCKDAGMLACLNKPIEQSKLLAVIEKTVRDNGGARPSEAGSSYDGASQIGTESGGIEQKILEPAADVIDIRALEDLRTLGGPEFVREVVEHFSVEATEVLSALDIAVTNQDYMEFRDQIHALRSGAANVGAANVFRLCMIWRAIEPSELALQGEQHLRELSDALVECNNLLGLHTQALFFEESGSTKIETNIGPDSKPDEILKAS